MIYWIVGFCVLMFAVTYLSTVGYEWDNHWQRLGAALLGTLAYVGSMVVVSAAMLGVVVLMGGAR